MYKPGHLLCPRSDNILVYQPCHLSWVLSSHSWLLWQSSLPISGSYTVSMHNPMWKIVQSRWLSVQVQELFQSPFLQVVLILCMQLWWSFVLFFSWHRVVDCTRGPDCWDTILGGTLDQTTCEKLVFKHLQSYCTPYPFVFPFGWNVTWLWFRSIAYWVQHLLTSEKIHIGLVIKKKKPNKN